MRDTLQVYMSIILIHKDRTGGFGENYGGVEMRWMSLRTGISCSAIFTMSILNLQFKTHHGTKGLILCCLVVILAMIKLERGKNPCMAIWQSHVPLDRNTNNCQGQDRGHSAHRFNSLLLNTRLKHGSCIINLQHIKFCSSISSVTISKMGGKEPVFCRHFKWLCYFVHFIACSFQIKISCQFYELQNIWHKSGCRRVPLVYPVLSGRVL